MAKLCQHIVIYVFYGRLNPTKICHIRPLITGQYRIVQHSVKTEILQTQANSAAQLKIHCFAENSGP